MHASLNNLQSSLIGNKGGNIDINLEQAQAVNDQTDTATAAQPSTPSQTQSSSTTSPIVIELSSKGEVASNIKNLHSSFAKLALKLRNDFDKRVKNGTVELLTIARSAAEYLKIKVSSLKYTDVDELFDSLKQFYDFFNCGVLQHLTNTYLSTVQTDELAQYIDDVDKFSESSQLKNVRSAIEAHLPASPSTSDQTKPFVIKLSKRWDEMTIENFKGVLKYYFDEVADLFSHISIKMGSVIITLLIPTTKTQSLIDIINNRANSMNRLGIMEVAVDNNTIPIGREDDNNFDASLHQSIKAGDSFEVSMLLQLGANPNNKDEEGKYPLEIAKNGGNNKVIQTLLTSGAIESKSMLCMHSIIIVLLLGGVVEWYGGGYVYLIKPTVDQCQEAISKLREKNHHYNIDLCKSSSYAAQFLLPQLVKIPTMKKMSIASTKLTKNNIIALQLSSYNATLRVLWITHDSIDNEGVVALVQSLKCNNTIIYLYLHHNPGITSASVQSLAELLLHNHTVKYLSLYNTSIDIKGILVLVESLKTNDTVRKLRLDKQHEQSLFYYKTVQHRLGFV